MAEDDTPNDDPEDTPDPVEDAEQADQAEPAEPAGNAEPADQAEPAGQAEPADQAEPAEPVDPAGPPEPEKQAAASGPPRRTARVAAIAVGAALAIAAAALGAAWAIVAIADSDDDRAAPYDRRSDDSSSLDKTPGRDGDRQERFDRDRQDRHEQREQAQRERDQRLERLEELKRDREARSSRLKELKREWQEKLDDAPRDGSGKPYSVEPYSAEECRTILSLGAGDDAVTVLICGVPEAETWRFERKFEQESEPGEDFRGFDGLNGFDFGPDPRGLAPLFEMFKDLEDFEGFPGGGRGFWFGSEDGDRGGIERRFCFGGNGEMSCFGSGEGLEELGELSEEQQQELEEWMESFRRFGPGRFLDGIPQ